MSVKETKTGQGRYALIDGLRGLAVVNMIAYHFLYDVFIVYGRNPGWYRLPLVHLWQQGICWSFIFIAGFSWRWGKKHSLRRGLVLNLCGLCITLVTVVAMPTEAIWFGILNFIGCAVWLAIPLDKLLRRVPAWPGVLLSFLLFRLFKNVPQGTLGLFGQKLWTLPRALYTAKVLTPFGFPYPGFTSSDYFPILPWLFLFLTGYFFYAVFDRHERRKRAAKHPLPPLSGPGRYSIWIYLAHQPLCMLVCMLLFGG